MTDSIIVHANNDNGIAKRENCKANIENRNAERENRKVNIENCNADVHNCKAKRYNNTTFARCLQLNME